MEKKNWDSVADDFEGQVLNVYANDKLGVIKSFVEKYSKANTDVADFGCGNGRGIALLSQKARQVYAIDISPKLLEHAKQKCKRLANVEYLACDLQKTAPPIPQVQTILSVNVLISADSEAREKILLNMKRSLKPSGTLILVVPSLESQIWSYNRLLEQAVLQSKNRKAAEREVGSFVKQELKSIAGGIVHPSDVDTKFYLEPELQLFLESHGFSILETTKINYAWAEENLQIKSRKVAQPWHWIVAAKKVR